MSMAVKLAKNSKMGNGNYMGDPGLFGDIWKGVKSVGRTVGGIAAQTGIPGVAQLGGIVKSILGRRAIPGASTFPILVAPAPMPGKVGIIGPGGTGWSRTLPAPTRSPIKFDPRAMMPGGAPAFFTENGGAPMAGASMGGYHINKTGYWVKDKDEMGNWGGNWSRIEAGTRWVKNRRRNPLNPRAASRAIARISSAKKATAMLGRVSIRKKC